MTTLQLLIVLRARDGIALYLPPVVAFTATGMDPEFLKRAGVKWGDGAGGSFVVSRSKYDPIPDAVAESDAALSTANERRPLFLGQSSSVIEDSDIKSKGVLYYVGIGIIVVVGLASIILMRTFTSATSPASPLQIVPGDASWLCKDDEQSKTTTTTTRNDVCAPGDGTPDYEAFMPIVYSILGDNDTLIARAIVNNTTPCPEIELRQRDASDVIPEVTERAVGKNVLPFAFPIRVCEVILPRDVLQKAPLYYFGGKRVPVLNDPSKFVVVGDTGLRSKPTNLGFGLCADGPLLYGVHQCMKNITKDDIDSSQFEGHFQDLSDWPLKTLMNRAIEEAPDILIHMGDFIYRQGPCPYPNNNNASCSGINLPRRYNFSGTNDENRIMNFIPGSWGDTFWTWWADFLYPSLEALSSVPWIALRGNHESCSRAGNGWFLLMSPDPYPLDAVGGSYCLEYTEPRQISFQHEQFLIIDDSAITPKDRGFDGLQFIKGDCPNEMGSDLPPPEIMNRFLATNPQQECEHVYSQLETFTRYFEQIREMSSKSDTTNFYLGHRPIFGIACNDTKLLSMDWTLQCSLACDTLQGISALFSGHMHWRESISFSNNLLPPQIIVGHGGTDLVENYIIDRSLDGLSLEVGRNSQISVTIEEGDPDSSAYGYGVLQRQRGGKRAGDYTVRFRGVDMTTGCAYDVDPSLTIHSGPTIDGRGSLCQQELRNSQTCSPPAGHRCSR